MLVAEQDLPRAAVALTKKLALDPAWRVRVVPGRGQAERGHLSEERNEKEKRHRVQELVGVDSVSVRARHADGRHLIVVWIRWDGEKRWTTNLAMHLTPGYGIGVPIEIAARQASAYAEAPDPASALAACS